MYCSRSEAKYNCGSSDTMIGLAPNGDLMNINLTNLNDLAHKILEEDLCKSYDIVRAHMDALQHIDCNGQTFLEAVFCKAIDENDIVFCQQHLPHLFCAHHKQRARVVEYAVHKNISFEDIQILLEHDFNSNNGTSEKPLESMEALTFVACGCALQERWDVLNWIASCLEDRYDREFLYLCCHCHNPNTFRHAHIPLDAISVVCMAISPQTQADFHWPRTTCDALLAYGLHTIDEALRNETLDHHSLIFYQLCAHIYGQNTKHLDSYLQKTNVVDAIQNPKNCDDVYNLINLCLYLNTPHAAQRLLKIMRTKKTKHGFLSGQLVHNMVWRNLPTWIFSKHVSQQTATWNFPFAVAYNHKEIGFLLLDIGVDLSQPINWKDIEENAAHFEVVGAGGEKGGCVWQQRLDNWVSEYEKSVLEIELQTTMGIDTQRKI